LFGFCGWFEKRTRAPIVVGPSLFLTRAGAAPLKILVQLMDGGLRLRFRDALVQFRNRYSRIKIITMSHFLDILLKSSINSNFDYTTKYQENVTS
jgi:hypothetical protein